MATRLLKIRFQAWVVTSSGNQEWNRIISRDRSFFCRILYLEVSFPPDSHSSFRRIFSCQNRRNLFETNLSLKKSYSSASSFLHRFWIYHGIREPKLDTVLLKHLYSFRGGVMLGEIGFSQLARA